MLSSIFSAKLSLGFGWGVMKIFGPGLASIAFDAKEAAAASTDVAGQHVRRLGRLFFQKTWRTLRSLGKNKYETPDNVSCLSQDSVRLKGFLEQFGETVHQKSLRR